MIKLRWFVVTTAAVVAAVIPTWGFNLIVSHTKLGHAYKVNAHNAWKFKGFIHDLEAYGRPIRHLGCYSRWGHVHLSQHHIGNACDIEQYGWGRTTYAAMYHIRGLAHKWGLRDGCEFGDCGHVDAGGYGWVNGAPPGMIASAEIPDNTIGDKPIREWPVTLTPKTRLASAEFKPFVRHKHANKEIVTQHHHIHHEHYASNIDTSYLFQGEKKLVIAELQDDPVTRREKGKVNKWLFY